MKSPVRENCTPGICAVAHYARIPRLSERKVNTAAVGDLGVLGAHVSWVRRKRKQSLGEEAGWCGGGA